MIAPPGNFLQPPIEELLAPLQKIHCIIKGLGVETVSPEETREILKLKGKKETLY